MALRIAVFGCGPAGLIAAHGAGEAALDYGVGDNYIAIFSQKRKSPLYGAQYLHAPIPHLGEVASTLVTYSLDGDPHEYRRKVYGSMFNGQVSPEALPGKHYGWDIRQSYDRLWEMYEPAIHDVDLDAVGMMDILSGEWDVVINSIPLDKICYAGHNFRSQEIIAAGDAPALGIDIGSMYRCPEGSVELSASPDVSWYRKSRIFGHTTVEWPGKIEVVPVRTASKVVKPLSTDCDCYKTVLKVGRYGTWKKGVLSHEGYESAYNTAATAAIKKGNK